MQAFVFTRRNQNIRLPNLPLRFPILDRAAMARLAKRSTPNNNNDGDLLRRTATRRAPPRKSSAPGSHDPSPSPTASFSSDKENQVSSSRNVGGKSRMSARGSRSGQGQGRSRSRTLGSNKRLRISDRGDHDGDRESEAEANLGASQLNRRSVQIALNDITDTTYYDPDQPMDERREVRRSYRDLSRNVLDSRTELMQTGNQGLADTLRKANAIFTNVKQTSEATLDSRLLVSVGDISAKRSLQNRLGGHDAGVDVDDFVFKCISFMRRGPSETEEALGYSSTQARRRQIQDGSDNEQETNHDDELNWPWLGQKAAFPNNLRPPVPGFLLGPLSVQKRVRALTQRRARQQCLDPADAVRPDEMKASDIQKSENADVTSQCKKLHKLLKSHPRRARNEVSALIDARESDGDPLGEAEIARLVEDRGILDNEAVSLFHFAFNPRSFGQTVENLFYTSFLIRDGLAGFEFDSNEIPTLMLTRPSDAETVSRNNVQKNQAVFHIDFDEWEEIVASFDISESIIPHRDDDGGQTLGASGWYG